MTNKISDSRAAPFVFKNNPALTTLSRFSVPTVHDKAKTVDEQPKAKTVSEQFFDILSTTKTMGEQLIANLTTTASSTLPTTNMGEQSKTLLEQSKVVREQKNTANEQAATKTVEPMTKEQLIASMPTTIPLSTREAIASLPNPTAEEWEKPFGAPLASPSAQITITTANEAATDVSQPLNPTPSTSAKTITSSKLDTYVLKATQNLTQARKSEVTVKREELSVPAKIEKTSVNVPTADKSEIKQLRKDETDAVEKAKLRWDQSEWLNKFITLFETDAPNEKLADGFKAFLSKVAGPVEGPMVYKDLCSQIAGYITLKNDASIGEKLLKENFREMVQIKDKNGSTPLSQLKAFFKHQRNLLSLEANLSGLKADILDAQPLDEAMRRFFALPQPIQSDLCEQIQKLDGLSQEEMGNGIDEKFLQKLVKCKDVLPIDEVMMLVALKRMENFKFSLFL